MAVIIPRLLRPDAQPTSWDRLTRSQKRATRELIDLLDRAASATNTDGSERPASERLLWLEQDRQTRMAFIDGERGTGKSTVLTTVIRAVDRGSLGCERSDRPMSERLTRLQSSVVWLEPIDVEPETDETNLLGAIMARIECALDEYSGRAGGRSSDEDPFELGNELEVGSREDRALARFRRVQNKLALAWGKDALPNGNSDAFQVEVRRRELAKLRIQNELNAVLGELGSTVLRHARFRNPLFVLPVDDLDLNPLLCVKLLDLLRAVTVPRLFTIALGSMPVTDFVMRLSYAARFKRTGADLSWVMVNAENEVQSQTAGVASNNLRKLIPPGQRVKLERISVEEALAFRPFSTGAAPPLHKLLTRIYLTPNLSRLQLSRLVTPSSRPNLLDLVLARPVAQGSDATASGVVSRRSDSDRPLEGREPPTYSGAHALASTPRQLTDLWQMLAGFAEQTDADPTEESSTSHLEGSVYLSAELMLKLAEHFDGFVEALVAKPPLADAARIELKPTFNRTAHAPSFTRDAELWFRGSSGWHFYKDGVLQTGTSATSVGALVLAYDLRAAMREDAASVVLLNDDPVAPAAWAETVWRARNDDENPVRLRWPTPPCSTMWQWDYFLAQWRQQVERMALSSSGHHDAAWTWIERGTRILDGQTSDGSRPVWHELFGEGGRLERLAEQALDPAANFAAASNARAWLLSVMGLSLPEYALDLPETLSPKLVSFFKSEEGAIFYAHRRRVADVAKVNADAARVLINVASSGRLLPGFVSQWQKAPIGAHSGPPSSLAPGIFESKTCSADNGTPGI